MGYVVQEGGVDFGDQKAAEDRHCRFASRHSCTRTVSLLLVILLGLATACGPRLIYPNLQWLIPWYLDDYLPIEGEQQVSLRADLEKILSWHCQNELERYSDFLRESARWFSEDKIIDVAFIEGRVEKIEQFYRDLAIRIGPDLVRMLRAADDEQIGTLFINLEEANLELLKKYGGRSIQERNERRQLRMQERLEKWIGTLTGEQVQAVTVWSKKFDGILAIWIDNRRHLQKLFHTLLIGQRFQDDFPEKLTLMLTGIDAYYTADYRATYRQSRIRTYTLLAKIGSLLTAKQRLQLVDELLGLADDLDALRCA